MKIIKWFFRFIPTAWLHDELCRRSGTYFIFTSESDKCQVLIGGPHDGASALEGQGMINYNINLALFTNMVEKVIEKDEREHATKEKDRQFEEELESFMESLDEY